MHASCMSVDWSSFLEIGAALCMRVMDAVCGAAISCVGRAISPVNICGGCGRGNARITAPELELKKSREFRREAVSGTSSI